MPQLLTATEVYEQKLVGYRFFVQVVTEECELDLWEQPVPKDDKVIDVVVTEPTREAIAMLVAVTPWLKGWVMVDC